MNATLRVPRTRGALSGLLLVLLGLWGALVPLVGPYFDFGFSPDKAWHLTSGRIWLQVVPGAAVFLGGLITLASSNRAVAALGAWIAALGGAWFVIGTPLSAVWATHSHVQLGRPLGDTTRQVSEQLSLLYGLGVVAVFLAAVALGRLSVVGVRDAAHAEATAPTVEERRPTPPRRENRPSDEPWSGPATSTQPLTPHAAAASDVKVAGRSGAGRPEANA